MSRDEDIANRLYDRHAFVIVISACVALYGFTRVWNLLEPHLPTHSKLIAILIVAPAMLLFLPWAWCWYLLIAAAFWRFALRRRTEDERRGVLDNAPFIPRPIRLWMCRL